MRRFAVLLTFLFCAVVVLSAESHWAFQGTVIKMEMADCLSGHNFLSNIGGPPAVPDSCPQYTVMSAKVVYEVVGRRGEEFMPLAEDAAFAIRNNEIVLFDRNEKVQARFVIKKMTLVADWQREQEREEFEAREKERSGHRSGYEEASPKHASMVAVMPQ